ncbi:MAG TPA: putative sulfate exporter family transporter, partial [Firmicutes bacterium]|nr:putative sulfate exporter family transporter [Bacillota bacterium]
LLFGAIMLFLYPALGAWLGMSNTAFGYWTGLSIDNTAEAVATGFAFSEAAGNIATIVKLSRN